MSSNPVKTGLQENKAVNEHKKRYRNFCIELYTETTSYDFDEVLDRIKHRFKFYSFIKHDLDENEETGEVKKAHVHFVVQSVNASTISALSKVLGVPSNFIQVCSNIRSATRYLVHKDDPDKYQYNVIDIETNDPNILSYFTIYKPNEGEQFLQILEYLRQGVSLYSLCKYCAENNMWATFRRNFSILRCFMPENNSEYFKFPG